MSHTLIPDGIHNLGDFIEQTLTKYSAKPAFTAIGQTKTFAEMDEMSYKFACYLQHELGLQAGDRIAIQLPNLIQSPVAFFGAMRAGLVVVSTNPLYTPPEMKHQFNDSGAKALVILTDLLPKYEAIKADVGIEHVIVTSAPQLLTGKAVSDVDYPCYVDVFEKGAQHKFSPRPNTRLDDTAALQYTGGTTGVSKGAVLSHGNLLSNNYQFAERMGDAFVPGEETIVCPLPLYHIYALMVSMVSYFGNGGHSILIPNPRDLDAFIDQIAPFKFTAFAGINTLFVGLCMQDKFKALDTSALKVTTSGGTALTGAAAELWLNTTGCTIAEGYGLSETSPVVSLNIPGQEQIGTVGFPMIDTDVQMLDDQDQPVADGESGEIAVKGPQVMQGYWNRPEETAKVMTTNGYFKTGDVGVKLPDGAIKIVDRIKDMIIVSGFNVYPNEIEDVLVKHPAVVEAAVVGKPDDQTQERVVAYISVNGEVTPEEVVAHCRESLTGYKVPKEVNIIDELPKSTVGKILRRELRG